MSTIELYDHIVHYSKRNPSNLASALLDMLEAEMDRESRAFDERHGSI